MKAKISEVFTSIQGEGKYAGCKQIFVRFFECNMHCHWCDTPYSIGSKAMRRDTIKKFSKGSLDRYEEMTIDQIFEKIKLSVEREHIHSVSLTGGEPLVQKEAIKELSSRLRLHGIKTYLETNGILPEALKETLDTIDIIAMDIKLPSSTKTRSYWKEHEQFLKLALPKDIFIKAIVTSDTTQEDILQACDIVSSVDSGILFILQPNSHELSNGAVKTCLALQEACVGRLDNVRIIPQMHKFLKLR